MVVCVLYAYNLTWGGLKNGKNGGEPNGFCLVFVVMEKKYGLSEESSTFKFDLFREIFFVNSALFIHSPYQTGSQPISGR